MVKCLATTEVILAYIETLNYICLYLHSLKFYAEQNRISIFHGTVQINFCLCPNKFPYFICMKLIKRCTLLMYKIGFISQNRFKCKLNN